VALPLSTACMPADPNAECMLSRNECMDPDDGRMVEDAGRACECGWEAPCKPPPLMTDADRSAAALDVGEDPTPPPD